MTTDTLRYVLLGALVLAASVFAIFWFRRLRAAGAVVWPKPLELVIGFFSDFFDTLGVGSFATTASAYRGLRLVPDRELPGTLNVGHAIPTVLQALIYISAVEVDVITLLTMVAASMLGAYLGAGLVARWPEARVRLCVGAALSVAAVLMFLSLKGFLPSGGEALRLTGGLLLLGVLGNFILGVLMTFGIGLYAPCMLLVSFLGMNPKAAFPIMMGSCAFLMLSAGPRFIRAASYAPRAALGLTLGGLPAVWIAATIVRELELGALRWLVLAVVSYTAFTLLWAARAPRAS